MAAARVRSGGSGPRRDAKKGGRLGGGAAAELTAAALETHNAETEVDVLGVDRLRQEADPFARVRKLGNAPSESDRHVVAVLAAVTQSIQEQGQQESPTAYWAALMTALEGAMADEPASTAVTFLLSMITPRVPREVLIKRFTQASALLRSVLTMHAATSVRLVRSTLTTLGALLGAQEASAWAEDQTFQSLNPLLEGALDARPKVRHVAQDTLASMVSTLAATRPNHPMVLACFKFCSKQLRGAARQQDDSHLLYLLNV